MTDKDYVTRTRALIDQIVKDMKTRPRCASNMLKGCHNYECRDMQGAFVSAYCGPCMDKVKA